MTIKELEASIKNGSMDEKQAKKMELVLTATKTLTSSIRESLKDNATLREETVKFLKHKKFRDSLLETILKILEQKETLNHLRRSELSLLVDGDASSAQYKEVCDKINSGIMCCIVEDENATDMYIMMQEIMFNYQESLTNIKPLAK